MSKYSNDKNPHSNKIEDGWIINQRHDDWKEGFLAAEKEHKFTEEEKIMMQWLFTIQKQYLRFM